MQYVLISRITSNSPLVVNYKVFDNADEASKAADRLRSLRFEAWAAPLGEKMA